MEELTNFDAEFPLYNGFQHSPLTKANISLMFLDWNALDITEQAIAVLIESGSDMSYDEMVRYIDEFALGMKNVPTAQELGNDFPTYDHLKSGNFPDNKEASAEI